jgi:acyl-CoA thioester hydrolase
MQYQPIETYRGFVYPWVIDHVGHMNVQSYTARFDEASWQFLGQLGLSPAVLKQQERSLVALEQRTHYRLEVLAGSLLHIQTELIEIKRKTIRFIHRMVNSETAEEVALMELLVAYFDINARATAVLPDFVATHASKLFARER